MVDRRSRRLQTLAVAPAASSYDEPRATIVPTLSLRTSYSDDEIDGQRDDDDDDGDSILVSTLRSPLVDGEDSTLDNENLARDYSALEKTTSGRTVLSRYFRGRNSTKRERTVPHDAQALEDILENAGVS